ncbi:transmembrane protein 59 [Bombina bombina]|uniref:transmembrane protein 59 n=1 Tax=Bombina bombina TaxID=8345 RepID=UPI00235AAF34|nr:transmembrane protein 59 [Bombina bombina]
MAAFRLLLLLLAVFAGARAALDGALGESSGCQRVCEGTYSLHTYPEEDEHFACLRGCRLFAICQFVDDGDDLNKTKQECDSACMEAYQQPNEQYACNMGCTSQMPFAEKRQEELKSLMPQIHLLFPITSVRSFWSNMMDSTHSFITSSWTFYMQADTGRIIVFQSEPEIQQMPQLLSENPVPSDLLLDKASSDIVSSEPTGEDLWQSRSGLLDGMNRLTGCFSVNTSWLLSATLVLSVLVLLWICCATVATASDQYIPTEKLSIYGDLEYLNDQKLHRYSPSALVVVHSNHNEEEAGPLPAKMDLTKSAL